MRKLLFLDGFVDGPYGVEDDLRSSKNNTIWYGASSMTQKETGNYLIFNNETFK